MTRRLGEEDFIALLLLLRALPELERGSGIPVLTTTTAVRHDLGVDRGRGGVCVYRVHRQRGMSGWAIAFAPLPLCDGMLVIWVVEIEELTPLVELGLVDGTIFLWVGGAKSSH